MGSTFHSLHYHIVFSTKERRPTIRSEWRPRLHKYLGGTVRGIDSVAEAVGGVEDHVHLLVSLKITDAPAELVRELIKASSVWAAEKHEQLFCWQEGYSIFSVSWTHVPVNRALHREPGGTPSQNCVYRRTQTVVGKKRGEIRFEIISSEIGLVSLCRLCDPSGVVGDCLSGFRRYCCRSTSGYCLASLRDESSISIASPKRLAGGKDALSTRSGPRRALIRLLGR